jgi:hypothetical protein
MKQSPLSHSGYKGGQVQKQFDDLGGKGGASGEAETTAPGFPSALRPEPSVPTFARDLRPASSTTSASERPNAAAGQWQAVWKKKLM